MTRERERQPPDPGVGFSLRMTLARVAIVMGAVAIAYIAWKAHTVLLLAFAGLIAAIFLHTLAGLIGERTKLTNGWALVLVVSGLTLSAGLVIWLLAPSVTEEAKQLIERLPHTARELEAKLQQIPLGRRLLAALGSRIGSVSLEAVVQAPMVVTGLATYVVSAFLVLFLGVYLAHAPKTYTRGFLKLFPLHRRARAHQVLDELGDTLRWWLAGRILSLCLVGMLTALGLWILGVPAPLSLGFVAGVLSFIPNFGPLLSLVPAVIVALPNGPQMVLYVILLYAGIQLVESYFITPLIQQRAVRLPPALILLAQILMGVLFGFLGLLLATPLTAVLLVLIKRLYIEDVLAEPGSKRGRAA